ncbi:MAG: adenine deaminase [Sphingobacteriales bacterium]|nr:adenine deaminase [Sphingobacteriales bacterium]OJY91968.1 MAG: adenine deaminase [Sphingobacteriales bacterium 44-15]
MEIKGKLVDILQQKIYPAVISFDKGIITDIRGYDPATSEEKTLSFILPGFIDAHVHIESSMLTPSQFARLAVTHGTIATVSDPHEIANVCGMDGVNFMIADGKRAPFYFYFGAPSCVPATTFETAGARLDAKDVTRLLEKEDIRYLSEMMNFPGVLMHDREVMDKIAAAKKLGKPVDGHAPGLRGEQAKQYIAAGISTDHECFTREEALDKLSYGMHIIIREGSAAKNFDALIDLLNDYPEKIMFCSDDKHPDSLVAGHINQLCARAIQKGINIYHVLRAACINPVQHYKLGSGLLQAGDNADFIVVEDLENFNVLQIYIKGALVADKGASLIQLSDENALNNINNFCCSFKKPEDFSEDNAIFPRKSSPVIEALDGQLITNKLSTGIDRKSISIEDDILKIAVVNRYKEAPVAIAYIKNFGLKQGALASSVAHDSHNIVAVGTSDEAICEAVNSIIATKGGISLYSPENKLVLPLPVAGLMSDKDGYLVAKQYAGIDAAAKALGSTLTSPYMTLSFMALLVIPHLKISDKGLFDGDDFSLLP